MLVRDLKFIKDGAVNRTRRMVQLLEVLHPSVFDQFWIGEHDPIFVFHRSYALKLMTSDALEALVH